MSVVFLFIIRSSDSLLPGSFIRSFFHNFVFFLTLISVSSCACRICCPCNTSCTVRYFLFFFLPDESTAFPAKRKPASLLSDVLSLNSRRATGRQTPTQPSPAPTGCRTNPRASASGGRSSGSGWSCWVRSKLGHVTCERQLAKLALR